MKSSESAKRLKKLSEGVLVTVAIFQLESTNPLRFTIGCVNSIEVASGVTTLKPAQPIVFGVDIKLYSEVATQRYSVRSNKKVFKTSNTNIDQCR